MFGVSAQKREKPVVRLYGVMFGRVPPLLRLGEVASVRDFRKPDPVPEPPAG